MALNRSNVRSLYATRFVHWLTGKGVHSSEEDIEKLALIESSSTRKNSFELEEDCEDDSSFLTTNFVNSSNMKDSCSNQKPNAYLMIVNKPRSMGPYPKLPARARIPANPNDFNN